MGAILRPEKARLYKKGGPGPTNENLRAGPVVFFVSREGREKKENATAEKKRRIRVHLRGTIAILPSGGGGRGSNCGVEKGTGEYFVSLDGAIKAPLEGRKDRGSNLLHGRKSQK